MGCDIHAYAELKVGYSSAGENTTWEFTGPYWKNEFYEEHRPPTSYNTKLSDHFYDSRNYVLFSILANVRNTTAQQIKPIDEPRGLPENVSEEVKDKSDQWNVDAHSHSWLTLEELLEAKNTPQYMIHEYYFNAKSYTQYLASSISLRDNFFSIDKPEWITSDEMKKRILLDTCTGNEATVVNVREEITGQLDPVINQLSKLLKYVDNDPRRIRMIFWFDN